MFTCLPFFVVDIVFVISFRTKMVYFLNLKCRIAPNLVWDIAGLELFYNIAEKSVDIDTNEQTFTSIEYKHIKEVKFLSTMPKI